MSLLLALDGGQTGTRALLAAGDGTVLSEGIGAPIRHMFAGGGQEAQAAVHGAIRDVFAKAGKDPVAVDAAACGVTSVQPNSPEVRLVEGFLREIVTARRVAVVPDYVTNLLGAADGEPGVVVVAGGGSIAYGQAADGREARAGGYGYLLGDEGGGFDIGRKAIAAAIHAADGRGPKTALHDVVCSAFDLVDLGDIKRVVYVPDVPRERIAGLTPAVARAAQEGDEVAVGIITQAGRDLASLGLAVLMRLFPARSAVEVYVSGGVFLAGEVLTGPFRSALRSSWLDAEVRCARHSPLTGALILARRLATG